MPSEQTNSSFEPKSKTQITVEKHQETEKIELPPGREKELVFDGPVAIHIEHETDFWDDRPTDPQDLDRRVHEFDQSDSEIAEDLGISETTVLRWLHRADVDREQTDSTL